MPDITDRMVACMIEGELTKSDLARWLGRSFATVRGWIDDGAIPGAKGGRAPREARSVAKNTQVVARVTLLERAIADGHFPLPLTEGERKRTQTIERIRNELERTGVLARRPA